MIQRSSLLLACLLASAVLFIACEEADTGSGGETTEVDPVDTDGDGLTDDIEADLRTDPELADTDGDTISDYDEIGGDTTYDRDVDTNPRQADTDGDGYPDNEDDDPLVAFVCDYPSPSASLRLGSTMPDWVWDAALADGTPYRLDMRDFYCDENAYGDYDTAVFAISAEWCVYCPEFQRYLDAFAAELEAAGMFVVFTELESANFGPIDTQRANAHISEATPNGSGVRLGDADNLTSPNGMSRLGVAEFFPSSFVIRRADMQIIADARSATEGAYLPFAEIAADPGADWTNAPAATIRPDVPVPDPNCTEDDEEQYENGNTVDTAASIGAGSFDGGICTDFIDAYYVDLEGDWSISIDFTHATGDLDMVVVDENGDVMTDDAGNQRISQSTGNNEYLEESGPQYVLIYGYNQATAPYSLTVEAR